MATKKDVTVEQKLRALFLLQQVDCKIDEIAILKGELPMEVRDLEDEIIGLQTRVTNLEKGVQGYADEITGHHNKIQEAENLILRYEKQLEEVKNNREYEALMKELELQKLDIKLSEKKIRGIKHTMTDKERILETAKANVAKKEKVLEEKKVELEQIIGETEKEEVKLLKKSEKAEKDIEERLIKGYKKIRKAYRNGLAVVTVERNSCGGCFNRIPPQMQLEIAQRKKVIVCEHCGRVLVDENIMSESTIDQEQG